MSLKYAPPLPLSLTLFGLPSHPGGNPGANLKSISRRCHPILVAFVWELTEETIDLPLGCLQGERERGRESGRERETERETKRETERV